MAGKEKGKKWFRRARIALLILCIISVTYIVVHTIIAENTMGPFLRGEKNGKWYVTKEGGYTITARNFKLFHFYGEVHVERSGSNRIAVGKEQPPTCALIAWRFVSETEYGLMITVPQEKGIHAYLIKITEEGEYISENILSLEEEAFVKTFLDDNKQEILGLIQKYKSFGGSGS